MGSKHKSMDIVQLNYVDLRDNHIPSVVINIPESIRLQWWVEDTIRAIRLNRLRRKISARTKRPKGNSRNSH